MGPSTLKSLVVLGGPNIKPNSRGPRSEPTDYTGMKRIINNTKKSNKVNCPDDPANRIKLREDHNNALTLVDYASRRRRGGGGVTLPEKQTTRRQRVTRGSAKEAGGVGVG